MIDQTPNRAPYAHKTAPTRPNTLTPVLGHSPDRPDSAPSAVLGRVSGAEFAPRTLTASAHDPAIRIRFSDAQQTRMILAAVDRQIERDEPIRVKLPARLRQPKPVTPPTPDVAPDVAPEPAKSTAPIVVKLTAEQAYRSRIAAAKARSPWW